MKKCRSWMVLKSFTNIYTANEEAVLMSLFLVSLDNSSTLLFILDNSGLKTGNCCWLVLLPVFPVRLFTKKIFNGKKWSSSFAGKVLALSFVIPLPYN